MSGTGIAAGAISLRACYAMSGTDLERLYGATGWRYSEVKTSATRYTTPPIVLRTPLLHAPYRPTHTTTTCSLSSHAHHYYMLPIPLYDAGTEIGCRYSTLHIVLRTHPIVLRAPEAHA
eukprot:686482-Rhodomonas_salina.1